MSGRILKVGLLGAGTVGAAVIRLLDEHRDDIAARAGCRLEVAAVAVRDTARAREVPLPPDAFVADPMQIVDDPGIDIVCELIGGVEPAGSLVLAAFDEAGALVGFACFGTDARVPGFAYDDDALDVGVGLRPDLVGRGHGVAFVRAVLELRSPAAYRVTVAAFNARALRLCAALGFREVARFDGPETAFVVLRRDLR